MFRLGLNKSDINGIIQEVLFDIGGLAYEGFQTQFRIFPLKPAGQRGKNMSANGDAGTDADGTDSVPVFHFLFHFLK